MLPGRKVSAFWEAVIVNKPGIRFRGPALRCGVDLIRKDADANRDGNVFRGKEVELVFPLQTSRRNRGVREPIERDIVEDVVSRKPLRLSGKHACDKRLAAGVVIEHPRGEADRGIFDPVQRLRTVRHLQCVAKAVLVEIVELIERVLLVG